MSSQPEDKFEQRIRERLQSWEATPSENAWSRIVADLPTRSPIWHRVIIVGTLISIIGGITLVWKWTMIEKIDEQVVQKDSPSLPFKSNAQNNHSPPPARSPFADPQSSSFKASADTTESSTCSEQQAPFQDSAQDRYVASQSRTHENSTQISGSSSRAAVAQSTVHNYVREPVDEKESNRQRLITTIAEKKDTKSSLNGTVTHAIPPVSTIDGYPVRIKAQLPMIATRVSSIELPPQLRTLPDSLSLESRWELWASTNPMLLYQQVTPNPSDEINVTSLNQSPFSKDRLGIQISAGVRYRISPRFALALGAYYRHARNRLTYHYHETLTDSFQIVSIDENTIQAQPLYQEQVGSIHEVNHHWGALVGLRYRLSSRWLSNIISTELQAHYDQDQTAWFTQISYLAEKKLGDHWSVSGGPTFLWNIGGNVLQYEHFALKPYGLGVQIGINYQPSFGRRR